MKRHFAIRQRFINQRTTRPGKRIDNDESSSFELALGWKAIHPTIYLCRLIDESQAVWYDSLRVHNDAQCTHPITLEVFILIFRKRLAALVLLGIIAALLPKAVLAKTHHHVSASDKSMQRHKSHSSNVSKAQAAHLARLAKQEKAAWREHLAKVRTKPRAERTALKRHQRRLVKKQEAARKPKSKRNLAKLARAEKKAWREHLAKVAEFSPRKRREMRKHDAHYAAQQADAQHHPSRVAKRHAAQSQHKARLAQQAAAHRTALVEAHSSQSAATKRHQAIIAQQQARHKANVVHANAAHLARLKAEQRLVASRALKHQLNAANKQSAHNARLAARRAHWVALHGDGSSGRSIKFWQTVAAGVPVKVITVDLNDKNVKVSAVMSLRGNGTSEPFRQMIERAGPNVAVTGTFFSMDNLHPIGDIVIDGSLVHFGGMGTALCVTPDNQAAMVTCQWGRHHDWSPYDFVVACGPRLLEHGRIVLDPSAERFRDREMLAPNSRIAVGITRGNKIVFAMTHKPIKLGRLARVMRSLGVAEAMNLDAGTSTGFYYNGATLARPGRKLTNMIVVYGRRDRYEHALDQLVSPAYRRSGTDWARDHVSRMARQ